MSPSGLHFHTFEIDSTWPIIAVSATKFKGLYCFFGCHGNNIVHLFWLLLRNSIIPENLKWVCSWFSELQRKRTSTWFEYCSCDIILASFPFKKWLSSRLLCGTLKWNTSRTKQGIYKRSTAFVLFSSALSSQTNFLFGWTFPLMQIHPELIFFYQMDSFSVHGDPDQAGSPDYFQQAIIAWGCINFHTGILSFWSFSHIRQYWNTNPKVQL